MEELPFLYIDSPQYSVRTLSRRRLAAFNASWATYKLNVTDVDYWQSNDPSAVLGKLLSDFLDNVITKEYANDVYRIVIESGSDKTITPFSTRFLKGYLHASDAILDRFAAVLQSHDEVQIGEPVVVSVTRIHSLDPPTEQLAHHMKDVATGKEKTQ